MFILKKISLACLLTVAYLFSFAQSKIEVRGKDSVAVISISDLRSANRKLVQLSECKEYADSLFSQIRTYVGAINNQKGTISDLKEVIKADGMLYYDQQKTIALCDTQVKKANRRIKILKLEVKILPPLALIVGGYLGYKIAH